MTFIGLAFGLAIFLFGIALLVGGIRGSAWVVNQDEGPWFLMNSFGRFRKYFGVKFVRTYAVVLGVLLIGAFVTAVVNELLHSR